MRIENRTYLVFNHSLLVIIVTWLTLFASLSYAKNKYWVFFRNKPNAPSSFSLYKTGSDEASLVSNGVLTQRAIWRRLKMLSPSRIISVSDFPVYPIYLDSLKSAGLTVTGTSRWFNAAVVTADSTQLNLIKNFSFVAAIKEVALYRSSLTPLNQLAVELKFHVPAPPLPLPFRAGSQVSVSCAWPAANPAANSRMMEVDL